MRYPFIILGLLLASPLHAGEVTATGPGSFFWENDPVDGPTYEQTPQGWRIYTHISQPVRIADQRGIENAKVIAEERAKAKMVAFMRQSSTSFVTHVQSDMEKSKTTAGADGAPVDDATTRDSVDILTQAQSSFASGTLYGVMVLAQDYDASKKRVTVTVGMSSKSADQARSMRRAMETAGSDETPVAPPANRDIATVPGNRNLPGSETHHRKSDDW